MTKTADQRADAATVPNEVERAAITRICEGPYSLVLVKATHQLAPATRDGHQKSFVTAAGPIRPREDINKIIREHVGENSIEWLVFSGLCPVPLHLICIGDAKAAYWDAHAVPGADRKYDHLFACVVHASALSPFCHALNLAWFRNDTGDLSSVDGIEVEWNSFACDSIRLSMAGTILDTDGKVAFFDKYVKSAEIDTHPDEPCLYESDRWTDPAAAIDESAVAAMVRDLRQTNGSLQAIHAILENQNRRYSGRGIPVPFLVDGLIPKGCVTLLAGNRKTGKSTIVTELAVTVGLGGGDWCGFKVAPQEDNGLVLLFCGEDSREVLDGRLAQHDPDDASGVLTYWSEFKDLFGQLDRLGAASISLIVVDPVRKYFTGDEDSSDAVSTMFNKLEQVAAKKNCAVLVTHHLRKDATPRNLADVHLSLRGSGVFLDRPRVHLAMMRKGDETLIGIPAPNGMHQHNMPPSAGMFTGQRRLRRDDETLRHIPLDADAGAAGARDGAAPSDTERSAILESLARLTADGSRITKAGSRGLWEQRPAELAGMTRKAARNAVDCLIADGALVQDQDGSISLAPPVAADIFD